MAALGAGRHRSDAARRDRTQDRRKAKNVIATSNWGSVATEFDAALVALPSALHGRVGIDLLEAGKHGFIEKPLAITSEDAAG